ncbi:MAG: spermidine/putrescine ABC transporter substrate-binding protein [Alkalinema sp. RU_4_3]|nr:spermidine/putrescine ABC transporter substrate-binding protein [Alkalinema sp. RU_4_3]
MKIPVSPSNPARRRFLLLAGAGLLGSVTSGCGWQLAKVQSAPPGKSGGDLYVYTWESYVDPQLLTDFQKRHSIKAISDVYDGNETMVAKLQAGQAANYSILYPSEYFLKKMVDQGLLREIDETELQGIEGILPALADKGFVDGKRYSVPATWGTSGLIYNSEKIPGGLTDWIDLWKQKDKLNRRITMLNDPREVLGVGLYALGQKLGSQNDPASIKRSYEKLLELKPAIAAFDTDAWRDRMLSGDVWVAHAYSTDAAEVVKDNPKFRYIIPQSGASLWVDTMAIPVSAPNIEAAYDWINDMLQGDVVAGLNDRLSFAPAITSAVEKLPPEVRQNPVLFPSKEDLAHCETMPPLSEAAEKTIDSYWTKLLS